MGLLGKKRVSLAIVVGRGRGLYRLVKREKSAEQGCAALLVWWCGGVLMGCWCWGSWPLYSCCLLIISTTYTPETCARVWLIGFVVRVRRTLYIWLIVID